MAASPQRRRARHSSSESSNGSSSSDDDGIYIPSTIIKTNELTLKDDEDTIGAQVPLPEVYGNKIFDLFYKK